MQKPTDQHSHVTRFLQEAVDASHFTIRPYEGYFTAQQLKDLHSVHSYETLKMVNGAQLVPDQEQLGSLDEGLRPAMHDATIPGEISVPNRLRPVIGIADVFDLSRFAENMIYVAAVLGPEVAAQMVIDWASSKPIKYERRFILMGISVEEPISVADGIRVEMLPSDTRNIYWHIPWTIGVDGASDFIGKTMIRIECEVGVDFSAWATRNRQKVFPESEAGMERFDIDWFCESLSLACDNYVTWSKAWTDLGPWAVFAKGYGGHGEQTVIGSGRRAEPEPHEWEMAWKLFALGKERVPQRLRRAIDRWRRSRRPAASLADRSIELRIALEALYLESSDWGDLRFRLATRGAWHLGRDADERIAYHKALAGAYGLGSRAVHADKVKQKDHDTLMEGQNLCLSGILKRIDEAGSPDWLELIMGKDAGRSFWWEHGDCYSRISASSRSASLSTISQSQR